MRDLSQTSDNPSEPHQVAVSAQEAASAIGLGISTFDKLVSEGLIRCHQVDRKRLFLVSELHEDIKKLPLGGPNREAALAEFRAQRLVGGRR